MFRNPSRRQRAIFSGVVVATMCVGAATFASILNLGNQSPQLPQRTGEPADYSAGQSVTGPGFTSAQAVAQVFAGLAGTPVQRISVENPPSTSGITGTGAPWLAVDVTGLNPNSVEANWLGSLAQGAVADLMRSNAPTTQAVIGGGEVIGLDNAGHKKSSILGSGFVVGGQQFASPSDEVLRTHIYDVASKFNLEVRSLTIVHPLDSAISVSFTIPDNPTVLWTIDELRAALEGSPKILEGSFIQLYSTSGEVLLSAGVGYRTGLGGLSFAPGQDTRFGAVHGHTPQQ